MCLLRRERWSALTTRPNRLSLNYKQSLKVKVYSSLGFHGPFCYWYIVNFNACLQKYFFWTLYIILLVFKTCCICLSPCGTWQVWLGVPKPRWHRESGICSVQRCSGKPSPVPTTEWSDTPDKMWSSKKKSIYIITIFLIIHLGYLLCLVSLSNISELSFYFIIISFVSFTAGGTLGLPAWTQVDRLSLSKECLSTPLTHPLGR